MTTPGSLDMDFNFGSRTLSDPEGHLLAPSISEPTPSVTITYQKPGLWENTDWAAFDRTVAALPSLELVTLQFGGGGVGGRVVGRRGVFGIRDLTGAWEPTEVEREQIIRAGLREKMEQLSTAGKLAFEYYDPTKLTERQGQWERYVPFYSSSSDNTI